MLREYELTIIINPQLSAEDTKKMLDKYEAILLGEDGEIIIKDDWGLKRLQYPIKRHFRGKYFFYDFLGNSDNLVEAERLMGLDENVMRYLIVRIGENVDIDVRKAELAKAEAAAAAQRQTEIS